MAATSTGDLVKIRTIVALLAAVFVPPLGLVLGMAFARDFRTVSLRNRQLALAAVYVGGAITVGWLVLVLSNPLFAFFSMF